MAMIMLIKMNKGKDIVGILIKIIGFFKYPTIIFSLIYLVTLLFLFNKTGIITGLDLFKDYIKLLIFTIIPMIVLVLTKYDELEVIQMIKEIIKLSIIPMYLIGEYTFSFVWEILLVFFVTTLTVIVAIGDTKPELNILKKFANSCLVIIGLFIIIFAFRNFSQNINDIYQLVFWKKMFLGLLVLFHLPLLLILQISRYYHEIIQQLKFKNTLVGSFFGTLKVIFIIFRKCYWNKNKLKSAFREVQRHRVETFNKLNDLLSA